MKIAAPIRSVDELGAVLDAGADEIYFGMVPQQWNREFGISTVSRRMFGNIGDYTQMQEIIAATHQAGKTAMLVLNAQQYNQRQAQCLLELAQRFAELQGDALIVADAPLLLQLGELNLGLRLHLSSIAACRNSQAAALFRELGAHRIIFPRYMKLSEIASTIRQSPPGLEFEAFVLNDGCIYEEGMCHTIHLPQQHGGPICMDQYRYSYYRSDGAEITSDEQQQILQNEQDYARWRWYKFSCGFSTSDQGYSFGPCGICALPHLMEMGLTSIKIAGREAPLPRKLKSIELVKSMLDRTLAGESPAEILAYGKQVRNRPELCESGYMCYYPEVLART